MSNSFLTVEDINGTRYANQVFYLHEIDLSSLLNKNNYTNIKFDFCTISCEQSGTKYNYSITVDNEYWTKGAHIELSQGFIGYLPGSLSGNVWTISELNRKIEKIYLYMGIEEYSDLTWVVFSILNPNLGLTLKELQSEQDVVVYQINLPTTTHTVSTLLDVGYNEIIYSQYQYSCGFLLVNLVKSDFQFNCTQSLVAGKVNKVALGTLADYKPSGDMIGDNTPTIQVLYGDTYIPVTFDSTLNDYVFNLDLTSKQNEGSVRFKVLIEANDVINASETEVRLTANYETINNETKLIQLFGNGGTGRIGANITLTDDLTVTNDVYLIGNDKTLTMDSHKIIVPTNKTFKADKVTFTGGENTIQQNISSRVELNSCTFTDCTGLGSVIDCQVNIGSLDNPTDFNTILTDCLITNCDMAILHGGELTVDNCNIVGKVNDANYPYFLYQTDGNATLLKNKFRLSSTSQISSDIGFNSCIFTCGDSATVNSLGHTELQNNDINSFLASPQYNTSTIDITYYHDAITDYIKLSADNGYCHAVSGIDKIYRSNVTVRRVE